MPNNFWKDCERRYARRYGTERIGSKQGVGQPDFRNKWLVAEVATHPIPQWVRDELQQAIDDSERNQVPYEVLGRKGTTTRLPIFIVHQKGDAYEEDLVVMKESDYYDWFGGDDQTS